MLSDPQLEEVVRAVLGSGCSGVNFLAFSEGMEGAVRRAASAARARALKA